MAQGLCWLLAKLADLTCVVASRSGKVALLQDKSCPTWIRAWFPKLLRRAGYLRPGEELLAMDRLGAPTALLPVREALSIFPLPRTQFSLHGSLRAEFQAGAFARFRAMSQREAADFAFLRNCAEN